MRCLFGHDWWPFTATGGRGVTFPIYICARKGCFKAKAAAVRVLDGPPFI